MLKLIRLEDLPNELLIEIFSYLDARRLYRSLYNLNSRLNILMESLTQLFLMIWSLKDDDDDKKYDDIFASRVHTLIIHLDVIYTLSRYINVRHLIVYHAKHDQIAQIMTGGFQLQTISLISPRCFYTTYGLHEMIFSNKFPSLKACHLTNVYSPSFELRRLSWSQSPLLRSLRISSHEPLIHVAILNACPNLRFLDLALFHLDQTPLDGKPHPNLTRMKFTMNNLTWPINETIFETFFSLIPYLKRLSIQRSVALPEIINDLLTFDWLFKVIIRHLPFLQQYMFYLHLINTNVMDRSELDKTICQIKNNFVNIYQNYPHYRLQIGEF